MCGWLFCVQFSNPLELAGQHPCAVPPFQSLYIPSEYVVPNQSIVFLLSSSSMAVKYLQDLYFMTGPVIDLSAALFIPLGSCYFFSELTSLAHKPQLI